MENQHVEGGETPHPKGTEHRLHHAMRCGNQMFAGCWDSGIGIIDVSDITKPKTLARYEYSPPHTEQTHTFLGVPHSIGGKRIAVSTEEERANRGPDAGKPHAPFRTWDVTDPTKPKLLCTYELPESSTPYDAKVNRGSAPTSSARSSTRTICSYVTWFAGGLRIMDISDPRQSEGARLLHPAAGRRREGAADQRHLQG